MLIIHLRFYVMVIHLRFSRNQDLECITAQRSLIWVRNGLNYIRQGSYLWTSYRFPCCFWYHQPSHPVRESWHVNWHEAGWRHFNDVHSFMYEVRRVSSIYRCLLASSPHGRRRASSHCALFLWWGYRCAAGESACWETPHLYWLGLYFPIFWNSLKKPWRSEEEPEHVRNVWFLNAPQSVWWKRQDHLGHNG